jgi:hypothetical protein
MNTYKDILQYVDIANEATLDNTIAVMVDTLNNLIKMNNIHGTFLSFGNEIRFDNDEVEIVAVRYNSDENVVEPWIFFPDENNGGDSFKTKDIDDIEYKIIEYLKKNYN